MLRGHIPSINPNSGVGELNNVGLVQTSNMWII